jgi:hypothetical protein
LPLSRQMVVCFCRPFAPPRELVLRKQRGPADPWPQASEKTSENWINFFA